MDDQLTLEKMEINKRLQQLEIATAGVKQSIDNLIQMKVKEHKDIILLLSRHSEILCGDGDPSSGLIVKVDRLEQRAKTQDTHIRLMWTSISTAFCKILYDLFRGR